MVVLCVFSCAYDHSWYFQMVFLDATLQTMNETLMQQKKCAVICSPESVDMQFFIDIMAAHHNQKTKGK